jgi:hypothetical protein
MTDLIDTKQMELHFEKANMAAEMVERGKGFVLLGAITAGKELIAAKEIAGHGNFTEWLKKNWNHSQSLANKYMKIANSERVTNLEEAKSIREALALSMVSEQDETDSTEHVPRAERKTGRVKVEQAANQSTDVTEKGDTRPVDDDPNPAPKTNTKHSPANAKAKEADRPVPAAVTPEFVNEPVPATTDGMMVFYKDDHAGILSACLECVPRQLMFDAVVELYAPVLLLRCLDTLQPGEVKAAKVLREAADKIDPRKSPKRASTPSAQELIDLIPDDWIDIRKDAAARWARSKQARPVAQRIPDTEAWQIVLEQMSKHEPNSLLEKVKNAHVGNWKGWNHDSANGKHGADAKPSPRKRDYEYT